MVKVTLDRAVRFPFDSRMVHAAGTVLEVSDRDEKRLHEMGAIGVAVPAAAPGPVDEPASEPAPPVEVPASRKFGPLPKKTQGINVWREYAREHDIDVRGLSEKSELMGYVMKVAVSAGAV